MPDFCPTQIVLQDVDQYFVDHLIKHTAGNKRSKTDNAREFLHNHWGIIPANFNKRHLLMKTKEENENI